ncbi:MAG: ABC transporter permease [Candidatus Altiarchaeota archaeon]
MASKTLVSLIIIVCVWLALSSSGSIKKALLPPPNEVFISLTHLVTTEEFYIHYGSSMKRVLVAITVSSLSGIALGLAMGLSKTIHDHLHFPIDFLRTMPSPALIPMALLLFGITETARIAVITVTCTVMMTLNTIYGVASVKKTRRNYFTIIKATPYQTLTKLVIPEAMPYIVTGLRTALSVSLIVVVVTEMIMGTESGLGYIISENQLLYEIPEMYAYILVLGITGYLLNYAVVRLEKKILYWTGQ